MREVFRTTHAFFLKCPFCGITQRQEAANKHAAQEAQIGVRTQRQEAAESTAGSSIYTAEYFLEEYRASYGRTYEEDREAIILLAKKRLDIIAGFLIKTLDSSVLDIGCALGYFLDEAHERGYATSGMEISAYAAEIARKRHRIVTGNILDKANTEIQTLISEKFHVITLWYVLEHISDLHSLLQIISTMQTGGDIFAVSVPNLRGLTGLTRPEKLFESSPPDHHYIFSLRSISILFGMYGYTLSHRRATGIHYSRFRSYFPRLSILISERIYTRIASVFHLGDTQELYFIKNKNIASNTLDSKVRVSS